MRKKERFSAKKVLGFLLLLSMIMSMLPVAAFAEEEGTDGAISSLSFICGLAVGADEDWADISAERSFYNSGYKMLEPRIDLNDGAGGHYIFLGSKTTNNLGDPLITGLMIYKLDKEPGSVSDIKNISIKVDGKTYYPFTQGYGNSNLNLNQGTNGRPLYLFYTRDGVNEGAPLLQEIKTENKGGSRGYSKDYVCGYDGKAINENQDLNEGAGGDYLYLEAHYHKHRFRIEHDKTSHWYECKDCGFTTARKPHVYETADQADDGYWKNGDCSLCSQKCDQVNIEYQLADQCAGMGTISSEKETLYSYKDDGSYTACKGATAIPAEHHRFVRWEDAFGVVVSEDPTFVPEKPIGGWPARSVYTAVFEEEKDDLHKIVHKDDTQATSTTSAARLMPRLSKATNKTISIQWNKVKGADHYEIYAARCNSGGKKYKLKKIKTLSAAKTSFTYSRLKKGTYYKMVVKAVKKKKILAGSKLLHIATQGGRYTNVKALTLNRTRLSVKKGRTAKVTVKKTVLFEKNRKNSIHKKNYFVSGNPKIATVNSKGVIKGVKKGSCYIYTCAQDGVYQRVKVIVR